VRSAGAEPPLAIPADLPLRLLSHRPDLAAARHLAEAAAKDIKVAKTGFYPDVNLAALAGLDSVVLPEKLFALSSGAFAVGPVLQLPIFQGGRLEARYQAAQASHAAAIQTYNTAVLRAAQEVADSLAQWRALAQQTESQEQAIDFVKENERLAKVNEGAGLVQHGPLLEVRYQLAEERYRLSELKALHRLAAVQLTEVLGGGYSIPRGESSLPLGNPIGKEPPRGSTLALGNAQSNSRR
jgi:outer membrane protein TolC